MTDAGKHVRWLVPALVVVAAVFRLPALEHVPPLLNQDEASRGYDAWCLLETGADRHGERWPFFLESFGPGDHTAALSTYLTIPFVALLGPTATAMRLPDAVLGVVTVWLLYLCLVRDIGRWPALMAAGMLAVDPWHIALCRTAHESGFAPFFLVFALLALQRGGLLPSGASSSLVSDVRQGGRGVWCFAAGFLFAMLAWAYPATRLFTPMLCLAIAIIYGKFYFTGFRSRFLRGPLIAGFLGLLVGATPLWGTAISDPDRLASRAAATLLVHQDLSAGQMVGEFLANYAAQFNPAILFGQADEMSGASIPWVGRHLPVFAPLWVIGLVRVFGGLRGDRGGGPHSGPYGRLRGDFGGLGSDRGCRLLVAWMVLYPIPAAICADWNPHPMRSVAGIALFPIVAALGGQWLIAWFAGRSWATRKAAAAVAGVVILANIAQMSDAYFRRFPTSPSARAGYQTGLYEVMAFAAAYEPAADVVLVTNEANQAYIYALLLEPVLPETLATSPMVLSRGPRGFHQVLGVGRYLFVPQDTRTHPEAGHRFQELLAEVPRGSRGLVLEVDRPDWPASARAGVLFRSDQAGGGFVDSNWPVYVVRGWRPGDFPPR